MRKSRWIFAVWALVAAGCTETPAVVSVAPPGSESASKGKPNGAKPKSPSSSPATAAQLIKDAQSQYGSGETASAASLLKQAIRLEPKNRKALLLFSGIQLERAGELERPRSSALFLEAATAARALRSTSAELDANERNVVREALFHEARTLAVEGKSDQALGALADALKEGFVRLDPLRHDHDLDSLRKTRQFQELRQQTERAAAEQGRVAADRLLAENRAFPFRFTLPGLDGKRVSLADYRGRVVLVDVWGTWCPPCRKEIPHLIELARTYQEKGLQVVGINRERVPDDRVKETIQAFVKEHGIPYPCLIGDDWTTDQITDFGGFPTTLFLDRSGKVRAKLEGFDPESVPTMEALIKTLLAEPSSAGDSPR